MPQTFTADEHTRKLEAAVREGWEPLRGASRGNKCRQCGSRLSAAGCKQCGTFAAVRPSPTMASKPRVETAAEIAARKDAAVHAYFTRSHSTVRAVILNDPEQRAALYRHAARNK